MAQYIYHPHYVDAVAVWFYDSDTDGTLDGDTNAPNDGEHYYLYDANFNVTAVTDDTGAVLERYASSPYGRVTYLDDTFAALSTQESTIDNEYLYTGRRLDPGAPGLQPKRNRFYSSELGRWVNRDPIGYGGGTNLYGYVGGMPTYYIDPSGLQFFTPYPPGTGLPPMAPPGPTPDEQDLIDFCEGDPACEEAMEDFIDDLDNIDWEESDDGTGPCFEYVEGCKNQCPEDPPGDCTVEFFQGKPHPRLLEDSFWLGPVKPTCYNIFGHIVCGYSEHAWGQICCPQSDGSTKCMNFDVGSDSNLGQFGGDDHLFPPNDPDFLYEIDPGTIKPIR